MTGPRAQTLARITSQAGQVSPSGCHPRSRAVSEQDHTETVWSNDTSPTLKSTEQKPQKPHHDIDVILHLKSWKAVERQCELRWNLSEARKPGRKLIGHVTAWWQ